MRFVLLVIIVVLFALLTRIEAQVVNVERLRITQDSSGWSGSAEGNFDIRRNQRLVVSLGSKAHVQYQQDSNTILLYAQGGLIKASGDELVNFAFSHLRYTHYVSEFLSWEAFTQLQQNRVNGIASRWLVGAGARGKIFDAKPGTAYLGMLLMREREREVVDSIPIHKDYRISSYLAGSYTPESAPWITIASTTYYQPRIDKFPDFRISSDWNLQVSLRQNLSLSTSFNLVYDTRPPVGLDEAVYSVLNGIRFRF